MGFSHFFPWEKVRRLPDRPVRTCTGTSAHGLQRLTCSRGGPMRRRRRTSCSLYRYSSGHRRSGFGKVPQGALLRRFPRARAVRSWKSGHSCSLSLAVSSLPEEYRNVGLFLGDDFMSRLRSLYLAVTCLPILPVVCLARQWMHTHVSLLRILGETAS